MNRLILFVFLSLSVIACKSEKGLSGLALQQLPASLEREMSQYMNTVGAPVIEGVKVLFDCDSLCVLQCKASALDEDGFRRGETIRYYFLKDTFSSHVFGIPQYCDYVAGGEYLEGRAIREFAAKIRNESEKQYIHYLGVSKPVIK